MIHSRIRMLRAPSILVTFFGFVAALTANRPSRHFISTRKKNADQICLLNSLYDDHARVEDDSFFIEESDDIDTMHGSSLASPLSQALPVDENTWYPGSYSRKENWVEDSTAEVMDLEKIPLGSLNEDDVESITGLMAAWVRRRSLEAALSVEKLLKRVVDDMRAGNTNVHVSARMYTIAIDAWAKSGERGGAERAQLIHNGMMQLHKQTGDPRIAPSTVSYNTVMNAWGKSPDPSAADKAENLFFEMVQSNDEKVKPDVLTISTLLDNYARSSLPDRVSRAEKFFDMAEELGIQKNVYTYSALQYVYARSGEPDAPETSERILKKMLERYANGDVFAKPNIVNYNAVLCALSRTKSKGGEVAKQADAMLAKMERSVFDGGYDIEPDRLSYALTILTCMRCPDVVYGAERAEFNLEKMEERARAEAQKRKEISSVAPPTVSLDLECFNVVLTAISRSRQNDAAIRTVRIVKRMENYAKEGLEHVTPNIRSWNAILNSLSRVRDKDAAEKAENILNHMFELHKRGQQNVKPDAFSFAAVLSTYLRLGTPAATQRADDIVRHMEKLYENGEIDEHPDVFHYSILCASWARSKQKKASQRVVEILTTMKAKHRQGYPAVKPNIRTYNACIDTLCKAGETDKAEELLYHMLALARDGDDDARPDNFSFNCVISSFTRSYKRDAGRRAESLLDRFFEFSEEFSDVRPNTRSFTHIIAHYARNKRMLDAPYRAEYVLNRLISTFRSGNKKLAPNVFAFTAVIDAYTLHKHPDAGENAERLVRTMKKLKHEYKLDILEINTGVMNSVLYAWVSSGKDNAGQRAQSIVFDMEKQCEEGDEDLRPNTRAYSLTLIAWTKSNVADKAKKTLDFLNHVKKRHSEGKLAIPPGEYMHTLVINACSFTKASPEEEAEAFKVAVQMMKTLLESKEMEPSTSTFGWFIQACGNLAKDEAVKEENIERAFIKCREMGLVNDFVLSRFKDAASDDLFEKIMGVVIEKLESDVEEQMRMKDRISLSDLPIHWTRKGKQPPKKHNSTSDVFRGRRKAEKRKSTRYAKYK